MSRDRLRIGSNPPPGCKFSRKFYLLLIFLNEKKRDFLKDFTTASPLDTLSSVCSTKRIISFSLKYIFVNLHRSHYTNTPPPVYKEQRTIMLLPSLNFFLLSPLIETYFSPTFFVNYQHTFPFFSAKLTENNGVKLCHIDTWLLLILDQKGKQEI